MSLFPMESPATRTEAGALRFLGWTAVLLGSWAVLLLLLQSLFGRQVDRLQVLRLGRELALQVRLTELTLERYPPSLIQDLTGLDLVVVDRPAVKTTPSAVQLEHQQVLANALCSRLKECPALLPADQRDPAVWIEVISPLEPVWLRAPLPRSHGWPPQPMLLGMAGVAAALTTAGLILAVEVERPLRRLERALSAVGDGQSADPGVVPAEGAPVVQRVSHRFNAMVKRLADNQRERNTMLAGIAHDLRAPMTRLRFRLSLQNLSETDSQGWDGDLDALERITDQFLLYAGGGSSEPLISCPLDQWLAEVVASYPRDSLQLDLSPITAEVRPVALGRAVSNLIDNAFSYGERPVVVRLRQQGADVRLELWDQGSGLSQDDWSKALQPFQRLDPARGQSGHCGLGLAIVNHVVQRHGGHLTIAHAQQRGPDAPGHFAVVIVLPGNTQTS